MPAIFSSKSIYSSVIILVLTLTGCTTEIPQEFTSDLLVERSRTDYEIFSLDYDPEINKIYYIEHYSWKSTAEKPAAILRSYDLNLEKDDPNRAKDIYTNFVVSNPESIWLQFGIDGNLYVQDKGTYDASTSTMIRPEQMLEFRDDKLISSTPIFTGLMMAKEFSASNKIKDFRERNKELCSKVLEKSSDFVPLGYYYTDDVMYTKAEDNSLLLPKYLKLKYRGTTYFMTAEECGKDNFGNYIDKFGHKKNLAKLNNSSEFLFNKDMYQLNSNLSITKIEKSFQWLMNFNCEKYSNILNWSGKKYDLGSCAKAHMTFPTSLNAVTNDGDLIYARMRGIYTAKP